MEKKSEQSGRTGRPLGFNRELSIETAMNLFWEKGVLPISAKDLASAMGIQRSSFYNTFGDKDSVFTEALMLYGQNAPDRRLDEIQAGQPVMPEIHAFLKDLCHVRASDPNSRGCMVCNGIAELSGSGTKAGEILDEMLEQRIAQMHQLFKQAQKQKEISADDDAEVLAHSFTAFLLGINLISKVVKNENALWEACENHLQGLLAGK